MIKISYHTLNRRHTPAKYWTKMFKTRRYLVTMYETLYNTYIIVFIILSLHHETKRGFKKNSLFLCRQKKTISHLFIWVLWSNKIVVFNKSVFNKNISHCIIPFLSEMKQNALFLMPLAASLHSVQWWI